MYTNHTDLMNSKRNDQQIQIQMAQDSGLHPGNNQLLKVQIIRMED